jgi:hypothetical protein
MEAIQLHLDEMSRRAAKGANAALLARSLGGTRRAISSFQQHHVDLSRASELNPSKSLEVSPLRTGSPTASPTPTTRFSTPHAGLDENSSEKPDPTQALKLTSCLLAICFARTRE